MSRALSVLWGLLGLLLLNVLGDAVSRHLGVSVPGSFWGFLFLLLALSGAREAPRALSEASVWLLNHLTLFLLPSLVAAAAGLRLVAGASVLLLVSGLLVTVVMAVACGLVVSALKDRQGGADGA
jgi:putative effector of murein hydrolase LrgA (UPF0299 family)